MVRTARVSAPLLTALVVLTFAGCGDNGSTEADAAPGDPVGVGQVRAGSVASLVQCSDWVAGTREQRMVTITDIRAQLNQVNSSGPTPDLSDDDAYALFERACAEDYAIGFRLYKLYARAAAFGTFGE